MQRLPSSSSSVYLLLLLTPLVLTEASRQKLYRVASDGVEFKRLRGNPNKKQMNNFQEDSEQKLETPGAKKRKRLYLGGLNRKVNKNAMEMNDFMGGKKFDLGALNRETNENAMGIFFSEQELENMLRESHSMSMDVPTVRSDTIHGITDNK